MKKTLAIFSAFCTVIFLTGCLKDKPNTDFSGLQPTLEISTASNNPVLNAPSSGYAYFTSATLFLGGIDHPDTISFTVNLASAYPLKKDVNFNINFDQKVLDALNADTVTNAKRIKYSVFPADNYSFPVTTGTIKAGTRLDTLQVIFFPDKIDFTKSLALPITITSADGVQISSNLSTIYFHQIGNPIAGAYTWDYARWPNNNRSGASDGSFTDVATFIPDDATTVEVTSGYYTATERYVISFTNTGGVLSDFSVAFNEDDVKHVFNDNGITVTQQPKILAADPVGKNFKFQYVVFNGSAYRWVEDSYHIP